eukprot:1145907-Pelagomonas_calceolata.AAC.1
MAASALLLGSRSLRHQNKSRLLGVSGTKTKAAVGKVLESDVHERICPVPPLMLRCNCSGRYAFSTITERPLGKPYNTTLRQIEHYFVGLNWNHCAGQILNPAIRTIVIWPSIQIPAIGGRVIRKHHLVHPFFSVHVRRFEIPALGQDGVICVEGTAEVVPGGAGQPSRLKAMFTSFSLTLGGKQRCQMSSRAMVEHLLSFFKTKVQARMGAHCNSSINESTSAQGFVL